MSRWRPISRRQTAPPSPEGWCWNLTADYRQNSPGTPAAVSLSMPGPVGRVVALAAPLIMADKPTLGSQPLVLGHWAQREPAWQWLANWPIIDIGSAIFTTGLLGVALQYFDAQDSEARATQRLEDDMPLNAEAEAYIEGSRGQVHSTAGCTGWEETSLKDILTFPPERHIMGYMRERDH